MRKWSGEVMVGGSKFWVEVGGRQGREEWEKESFVSPWRKSREEDTERVRRKAKGGGEGEEHDPTVELFNAHWREVENFEEVENTTKVEEERQVCKIAEEEQEREVEEEQERMMEEEGSDEDWGQEVEAYSRRGGLGVRFRVGHADASADAHRMRINAHRCASSAYWAKNEIPFFTYKLPFWLR